METRIEKGYGVIGKVVKFTTEELRQMSVMCHKVVTVLDSHTEDSDKKLYLNDEDLQRLEAIFMCILETENYMFETCFDRYKRGVSHGADNDSHGADNDDD